VVPIQADHASKSPQPANPMPPLTSLKPLDTSGGYILQASIRVQDGTKPETLTLATNELARFKELIKGVVDLAAGDRLALDTRMR
jgi:mediator of RNA polymerase II transcription subunit 18